MESIELLDISFCHLYLPILINTMLEFVFFFKFAACCFYEFILIKNSDIFAETIISKGIRSIYPWLCCAVWAKSATALSKLWHVDTNHSVYSYVVTSSFQLARYLWTRLSTRVLLLHEHPLVWFGLVIHTMIKLLNYVHLYHLNY